jgi:hypothetical protein
MIGEPITTQTHRRSNPTPTLSLPLKGREIAVFLPLQGGGQEGDGVSVGVVLSPHAYFMTPT